MANTRLEADSIGTLNVPEDAYYGVQSPADALDWAQKEFDNSFPSNNA